MPYDPDQITFFAKTDARGQNVPFGIKSKDRTRHVYVIGKTGMGKSTLLENMAVQDMQHGNGLAFIDPHGATAETLLQYVPENRADDVLYFAPFDTQHPVAFNVMEDVGPEKRHLVAAGLMSVFKKIWVDAWSARMEYILQNTLLALLEFPNSTLLGVNRMLSEKHYRKAVIDNISDPAVKSFWVDEFLNYNERYMQEAGDAIKNKIGQFTANPLIRNIIGQPHTSFDLRQMMDDKKILIANLSKGLIGEGNANLLGSMLTTRIYLAAMSRADLSPQEMKQMPNFYFYVDEFQSFANATFSDILSEARKYHLNLTIAHQYVEQMEEEVRNAVFGNVGTIISFRVGPFDAEILETIFAPQFYAVDIVNLGFAQIYLSLMIDGIGSRPFSASTLPPIEIPHVSCRDMVVARSRDTFGSERATVEENINTWMTDSFQPRNNQGAAKNGNNDSKGSKNKSSHGTGNDSNDSNGGSQERRAPASKDTNNKPNAPARSKSDRNGDDRRSSAPNRPTATTDRPPANANASKPNLDELRSVLRTLAKDTADEAAPTKPTAKKKTTPHKPVEARKASANDTPSRPATDTPPAKSKPSSAPTSTNSDQPAGATPSLKDALAAVLAEHRDTPATQANSTPAPATQPTAQTNTDTPEAKSHSTSATTVTDTPPASEAREARSQTKSDASAPPNLAERDTTYHETKSKDALDPKAIERMLRVTGSDNSPFKKR